MKRLIITFVSISCLSHANAERQLTFKNNNEVFIATGDVVQLYNLAEHRPTFSHKTAEPIESIAYQAQTNLLLLGLTTKACLLDLAKKSEYPLLNFNNYRWHHTQINFCPDKSGLTVLNIGYQGRYILPITPGFAQNTRSMIPCDQELCLIAYNNDSKPIEKTFHLPDRLRCAALTNTQSAASGDLVVVQLETGDLLLWDTQNDTVNALPHDQNEHFVFGTVSPDGHYVFISSNLEARLWDVGNNQYIQKCSTDACRPLKACFSADSSKMVVVTQGEATTLASVYLFSLQDSSQQSGYTNEAIKAWRNMPTQWLDGVALAPDGCNIVACATNGFIRIFNEKNDDPTQEIIVP